MALLTMLDYVVFFFCSHHFTLWREMLFQWEFWRGIVAESYIRVMRGKEMLSTLIPDSAWTVPRALKEVRTFLEPFLLVNITMIKTTLKPTSWKTASLKLTIAYVSFFSLHNCILVLAFEVCSFFLIVVDLYRKSKVTFSRRCVQTFGRRLKCGNYYTLG